MKNYQIPTPVTLKKDMRAVCLTVAAFVATIMVSASIFVGIYVAMRALTGGAIDPSYMSDSAGLLGYINSAQFTQDTAGYVYESIGFASCASIITGAMWFFLIRGKRFVTSDITTRNARMNASMLIQLIVVMLGVQFVMVLINIMTQPLLNAVDVSATDALQDATATTMSSPIGILYIVLIGPIMEELVFRGAVMRKLQPYGANFAMVTSAMLFGMYHLFIYQAVFAFMVGLVFAYVAGRYSLKWAIVLHILNNALACLASFSEVAGGMVALTYIGCFVAAIILLIIRRGIFKVQKRAGAPLYPKTFQKAYSSPFFIGFVAIFLLVGTLMMLRSSMLTG